MASPDVFKFAEDFIASVLAKAGKTDKDLDQNIRREFIWNIQDLYNDYEQEISSLNHTLSKATSFLIDEQFEVRVDKRGENSWAILDGGNCLGRNREWEYEPLPTARTDDFKLMYRFDSFDEAEKFYDDFKKSKWYVLIYAIRRGDKRQWCGVNGLMDEETARKMFESEKRSRQGKMSIMLFGPNHQLIEKFKPENDE